MVGETFSRYRVVAPLGTGGVGEVYRAEDLRLRRPVALKLVPLSGDAEQASRRLLAEARAASALTHPNIAVVYEVDEAELRGVRVGFIAMEYVAGRTLTQLAAEQPLTLDTALDLARQIADALAAAHALGLIHRDIKPSNVMVTDDLRVKVLDFGLARWSAPSVVRADLSTRTADPFDDGAQIAGTLPYMSPEQATGRRIDLRTDMFSLGVVLYELLAGRRPFGGENVAQLLEALLQADPPPIRMAVEDLRVREVERVVRRMLEKNPAARYDDLHAVKLALETVQRGESSTDARSTDESVLIVTDFRNITANAEDDWLGTGIAETVTSDLRGFEGLSVVPSGRVHQLVRTIAEETRETADALWIRAGREFGARWVLTGSFQRSADAVRVTASLVDVTTGQAARTIKVDGRLQAIFDLQDRLVREVADALRAVTRAGAASQETGVVGAYEAFSKAMINLRAETYESLDRAVLLFERAVALDDRYARAHVELGAAYGTKADYFAMDELRPRAVAHLRRGLELQPDSVRAWRELGSVLISMGQDREGFDALDRAVRLDPNDPGALSSMGRAFFIGRARFDEAASWYEKALAVNPKGGWYALQLAHCAALLRDYARGESAARRAIELQEALLSGQEGVVIVGGFMRLGHLEALQGRHREAVDRFLQEVDFLATVDHALRSRIIVELNVRLGASYLALGQTRKGHSLLDVAIEAFDRRVRLGADEPFTRFYAAAAHALEGDGDTAIAFLERAAARRRAFTIARARIEPEFESLRTDERFQRLLGPVVDLRPAR